MEQHLIVLDLDGTTLESFESIHPKNKEVIYKLKDKGHKVVIITGRPYRTTKHFYDELELDTIVGNQNGAWIHHPKDESFNEIVSAMNSSVTSEIINSEIMEYIDNYFIKYKDNVYVNNHDDIINNLPGLDNANITNINHNELNDHVGLILISKKDHIEKVKAFIETKENVKYHNWTHGYDHVFDVKDGVVSKADALEYIREHYGINKENVIAIGDGMNDLEMIEYAHIGVAMNNGEQLVKEKSKHITEFTNTEGGVGIFLEKYFKLK